MRVAAAKLVLLLFSGLVPQATAQKDAGANQPDNPETYEAKVVAVQDVSRMKSGFVGGFADMQRQLLAGSKITMKGESSEESGELEDGPNGTGTYKLKGKGSGGGTGGGIGGGTRFSGTPKLGIALEFTPKATNQRFEIQNFVVAIDETGTQHKALATASRPMLVVPKFEADNDGRNTVYFVGTARRSQRFASISGRVKVLNQDIDEILFKTFRPAQKKSRLGEYELKAVKQEGRQASLIVRAPIPKSYRKDLELDIRSRARDPQAMARYRKARLESRLAVTIQLQGSDGLWYQPNTSGNAPSQQQATFTTSSEEFGKNGVRRSRSGSNPSTDFVERAFSKTNLPAGTKIVGVRVRVTEKPESSQIFKFKVEDVALRAAK